MLIRFLFFLILFYLVSALIRRMLHRGSSRSGPFGASGSGPKSSGSEEPEGRVSVKYKQRPQRSDKNIGEYIDYEEVPDEEEPKS